MSKNRPSHRATPPARKNKAPLGASSRLQGLFGAAGVAAQPAAASGQAQGPEALFVAAVTAASSGDTAQALRLLTQVTTENPQHGPAWHRLGFIYGQMQDYTQAAACLSKAAALQPRHAGVWRDLGDAWRCLAGKDTSNSKNMQQALACYQKTLQIQSSHADAWYKAGVAHEALSERQEALDAYTQAIKHQADHASAYHARGMLHATLGNNDVALSDYSDAIRLRPAFPEAWNNRGNVLKDMRRFEEAAADFRQALALWPDMPTVRGVLLNSEMMLCHWERLEQDYEEICSKLRQGILAAVPFPLLAVRDDPEILKLSAALLVRDRYPAQPESAPPVPARVEPQAKGPRKIRVGYFSADLHDHATAYLMAEVWERHDKSRFESMAFSFGPDNEDAMRKRVRASFDAFLELRLETDQAIAERARAMEIDIAIDLKGFTQDARTGIFAQRVAPVQINYLGYPGTMSAPYIDYLIADAHIIPDPLRQHYSEQIIRLPHSYQPTDTRRSVSENTPSRTLLGLPQDGTVFCCFNSGYKITPSLFAAWMQILKAVPGSVLWLLAEREQSMENLRHSAQKDGVDPSRLVFAGRLPQSEHLSRYRLADLFLDCWPCNAHTTASDALWVGLPLITYQGQAFASRVASSLLHAVGLPECVVHSHADYVDLAIALGQNPQRRQELQVRILSQGRSSPLFNPALYTRHFETALRMAFERQQNGLAPAHFDVPDQTGLPPLPPLSLLQP